MTSIFSLDSAAGQLARLGKCLQRVEALAEVEVHLPLLHELERAQDVRRVGTSSLGSQSNAKLFSAVAAGPHMAFRKLTMNFL